MDAILICAPQVLDSFDLTDEQKALAPCVTQVQISASLVPGKPPATKKAKKTNDK